MHKAFKPVHWKLQVRELSKVVFIVVFLELSAFHSHHTKSLATSQQVSKCELLYIPVKQTIYN